MYVLKSFQNNHEARQPKLHLAFSGNWTLTCWRGFCAMLFLLFEKYEYTGCVTNFPGFVLTISFDWEKQSSRFWAHLKALLLPFFPGIILFSIDMNYSKNFHSKRKGRIFCRNYEINFLFFKKFQILCKSRALNEMNPKIYFWHNLTTLLFKIFS